MKSVIIATLLWASSASAGIAQAGIMFDCNPATGTVANCQTITTTLVSDAGPTDTYDVSVLGVTRRITLDDHFWLEGGRYELAANTMDHTLDVNLFQDFDGFSRTLWIGHGVYTGTVHVQNFGHWGSVPEPGIRALIGLALGTAWLTLRRKT